MHTRATDLIRLYVDVRRKLGPFRGILDSIGLVFACAVVFAVYVYVVLTPPVGLVTLATTAGWWWIRRLRNPWGDALGNLLLPLAIGFGADSALLLAVNFILPHADAEKTHQWIRAIRAIDEFFLHLRDWVHRITTFGLPKLAALPAFLLILILLRTGSHVFPRANLVTRFASAQRFFSSALVALTAMTTFTLFSAGPLDGWAIDYHTSGVDRYHDALRRELDAEGRYLAAEIARETVQSVTQSLNDEEKWQSQAMVLRAINNRDAPEAVKSAVARRVGEKYAQEGLSQPEIRSSLSTKLMDTEAGTQARSPEETKVERMPASAAESLEQRSIVEREEARADQRDRAAKQAEAAREMALAGFLGFILPEFPGIAGPYFESLSGAIIDPLASAISAQVGSVDQDELLRRARESTHKIVDELLRPESWIRVTRSSAKNLPTTEGEPTTQIDLPRQKFQQEAARLVGSVYDEVQGSPNHSETPRPMTEWGSPQYRLGRPESKPIDPMEQAVKRLVEQWRRNGRERPGSRPVGRIERLGPRVPIP